MPLALFPATESDLPILVQAQYAAFHPYDALHMLIYPSPSLPTPEIIQGTIARQAKSMRDETVRWIKISDESTIIAGSKWCIFPPDAQKGERWREKIHVYWVPDSIAVAKEQGICGLGAGDREYVKWVLGKMWEKRREKMQGPGVLLDLLFTHPDAQGKGAGKMMVDWGCERADEIGVGAWVEASYKGVRLYESCGFRKVEEVVFEGGKEREEWREYGVVGYCFMAREAKGLVSPEKT